MFVAVRFLDSSKSISLSSAFVNTFLKLFLKIFSSIFFKLRRPLFRSQGFLSSFAYRILPFSFVFVNTFWQTFLYILHYQLSFGTMCRVFSCFASLLTLYIGGALLFLFFFLYVAYVILMCISSAGFSEPTQGLTYARVCIWTERTSVDVRSVGII